MTWNDNNSDQTYSVPNKNLNNFKSSVDVDSWSDNHTSVRGRETVGSKSGVTSKDSYQKSMQWLNVMKSSEVQTSPVKYFSASHDWCHAHKNYTSLYYHHLYFSLYPTLMTLCSTLQQVSITSNKIVQNAQLLCQTHL
jgi:hypothetical protein